MTDLTSFCKRGRKEEGKEGTILMSHLPRTSSAVTRVDGLGSVDGVSFI
jgi:hypothetical protein